MLLLPGGLVAQPGPTFAAAPFAATWSRYDLPVQQRQTARSWTWGPEALFSGSEAYRESPGGQRLVQYFDKTRLELNDPGRGVVTSGLLVRELVAGRLAIGDADGRQALPSTEAVAGDRAGVNPEAPTYASFAAVATLNNDRPAADRTGQPVDQAIDRGGRVTRQATEGARYAYYESTLKHNIADVFWSFMNQRGPIFVNGSTVADGLVYDPWFAAMGLPISEPYWTRARVGGQPRDVLVQLFERRVLTYTPANPEGFRVEMGNVGQHYYRWRYQEVPALPTATATATPPPTPTPVPRAPGISQPAANARVGSPVQVQGYDDGSAVEGRLLVRVRNLATGAVLGQARTVVARPGGGISPFAVGVTYAAPGFDMPGAIEYLARTTADGPEEVRASVYVTLAGVPR